MNSPSRQVRARRGAVNASAEGFWWNAAWLAACVAGVVVLLASGWADAGRGAAALAIGGLPALAGLGLAIGGRRGGRRALLVCWTLAAAAAVLLCGGALGPLGVWCLAPLAFAAVSGRPRLTAAAGAAVLGVLGLGLLSSLLGGVAAPAPPAAGLLRAVALVTVAGGLALGLVGLTRRFAQQERAALGEAGKLRRLADEQPALLLDLLPDGRIAAAFGRTLDGAGAMTLAGQPFAHLAAPAERDLLVEAMAEARARGQAERAFTPASDPEGMAEARLRRIGPLRVLAVVVDAGARRRREALLEAARVEAEQQNAGKSRFLANMSHELRTPLNAIMGFSDIMRSRLFGPLSDRYAEYAELIHESGGHLLDLINDVLDMSKIEAERFDLAREVFDGREAITAVLRLMRGQADRAGVQLRGVLPREPLDIDADRRALKQIALNLVSNALKFTPRGGAVTVGLQAAGGQLELVVADTGTGMSAQDAARVGRPYEQAGDAEKRAVGTGLGLSLVRSFAELHGGDMFIESALGEGTTVTVRMPVLAEAEAPAPTVPAEAP